MNRPRSDNPEIGRLEEIKASQASALLWLKRSISSLVGLWNPRVQGAFRNTDQMPDDDYRPTATFHAVAALGECGVWNGQFEEVKGAWTLKAPYFTLSLPVAAPAASDVLDSILFIKRTNTITEERQSVNWLERQLKLSSHLRSGMNSSRLTVVLERLLSALVFLTPHGSESAREIVATGLGRAVDVLSELLTVKIGRIDDAAKLYASSDFTPAILLNVALCLEYLESIAGMISEETLGSIRSRNDLRKIRQVIQNCLLRHIDHHMARHRVESDPSYDPVSLAFALRGLYVLHPNFRAQTFFKSCLSAVIEAQHRDGCWPDGVSITYEATADVVQQPSVGVAVLLAECIIDQKSLVDYSPREAEILDLVLGAMRRMSQYLHSTYSLAERDGASYTGWSSDRVRRPNYCETWITAMATRFFFRLWLGEKAAVRGYALSKMGVLEHKSRNLSAAEAEEIWNHSIVDPDSVTQPATRVWSSFIKPIVEQRDRGVWLQYPPRDSVSFILFGPPGSGKTFFVQSVARILGWPLVTLTPGHFIRHGLELIEATAREMFDLAYLLDHAVLFFDECDELFRRRDANVEVGRSILSFATASMLPKLQALHDSGNLLFILGTNYLRNIDSAVRRPGRFDEIFLFDRPDGVARDRIIRSLLGDAVPDVRIVHLVGESRGLTYKEVRRLAEATNAGVETPVETSLADYQDWCAEDGPKELEESRLTEMQRREILKRWLEVKRVRE